jgi:hypothetical protein
MIDDDNEILPIKTIISEIITKVMVFLVYLLKSVIVFLPQQSDI